MIVPSNIITIKAYSLEHEGDCNIIIDEEKYIYVLQQVPIKKWELFTVSSIQYMFVYHTTFFLR